MDSSLREQARAANNDERSLIVAQIRAGKSKRLEWTQGRLTSHSFYACLRSGVLTDRELRLFAADCAEHVLPSFERIYINDPQPRRAIQAARAYAEGSITADDLMEARERVVGGTRKGSFWHHARDAAVATTYLDVQVAVTEATKFTCWSDFGREIRSWEIELLKDYLINPR